MKFKDIRKLMKNNKYFLFRMKKHAVWKHSITGKIITTPKTPSDIRTLKNIAKEIKKGNKVTIQYIDLDNND